MTKDTFTFTRDDLNYLRSMFKRYLAVADKYYSKDLFTQKMIDEDRNFFNEITEMLFDQTNEDHDELY